MKLSAKENMSENYNNEIKLVCLYPEGLHF